MSLPPSIAVPLVLICSVSRADLDAAVDVASASTSSWPGRSSTGGLAGMPIGTLLVARADPQNVQAERRRDAAGVSDRAVFSSARRWRFASAAGRPTPAVGFAGGILGGLAGLSGPLPTLWASVRGWTKDQRRGVFQIFNGTVLGAALCLQIATGFVKADVFWLALLALPGTLIGARLGMRTYHALNDRNFYDVVLALLFLSGLGLVWSSIAPR